MSSSKGVVEVHPFMKDLSMHIHLNVENVLIDVILSKNIFQHQNSFSKCSICLDCLGIVLD